MSHTSKARVHVVWQAFGLLPVALAVAALLVSSVVSRVALAAEEETFVVDANSPPCMATTHPYLTISAAVTAAASDPGVTIDVCPGTYAEQVKLDTAVTLKGVTVPSANGGNGAGAAIITVPTAGLSANAMFFSTPLKAQVLVTGSNVTLSDLTIDGTGGLPSSSGCVSSSNYLAGVDFDSLSSGTVRHLDVRNQNQSNGSGGFCASGFGIVVNKGAGDVTVRDSSISNYDSAGIAGLVPVDVENNVLRGAQGAHGQTIGIGLETTGSEQSTISSNSITTGSNDFFEGEVGMAVFTGLATLSGNRIAVGGTHGVGILDFSSDKTVISDNVISGVDFGEIGIGTIGSAAKTVRNNYVTAVGGGVGIALAASEGDTVTGNTINGAGVGISSVTGNTVNDNTFFNVGQLTAP